MKHEHKKIALGFLAIPAAGIGPNLFVVSQAGYANLSNLAVSFLFPAMAVLIIIFTVSYFGGVRDLSKQLKNGFLAGIISTIGLEIIREIGFHLGWMPGDLPKLMGVLLLNQFALGPDTASNIAGWSYHFWNGASFAIIYSIIFGRGRMWIGVVYGIFIGIGFMAGPVAVSLGVGSFGVDFGWGFPVTVTIAHIVFGSILGLLIFKWNTEAVNIFSTIKNLFKHDTETKSK